MQVILLDTVQNLGGFGDRVRVKAGYARNFLIPKGYALSDTAENRTAVLANRVEWERQQQDEMAHARARADALSGFILTIPCKAGELGRLYGSIGVIDIVKALVAQDHPIERPEVRIGKQTFREVGDYPVTLLFHRQVETVITVRVVAEVKAKTKAKD